jgi:hypothetical protein
MAKSISGLPQLRAEMRPKGLAGSIYQQKQWATM